jgi:hypothetical protein
VNPQSLTDSLDAPVRHNLLAIPQAEACCEEKDGIDLREGRVPVGSKEIGERVQYGIDDVHHGQRPKNA